MRDRFSPGRRQTDLDIGISRLSSVWEPMLSNLNQRERALITINREKSHQIFWGAQQINGGESTPKDKYLSFITKYVRSDGTEGHSVYYTRFEFKFALAVFVKDFPTIDELYTHVLDGQNIRNGILLKILHLGQDSLSRDMFIPLMWTNINASFDNKNFSFQPKINSNPNQRLIADEQTVLYTSIDFGKYHSQNSVPNFRRRWIAEFEE